MAVVLTAGKNPLYDQGYLILRGFMSAALLNELRDESEALWKSEGGNAGSEFRMEPGARRLANLCDKGEVFRRIVAMPEILSGIGEIITESFRLSSLNARSTNPHCDVAQPLHCDTGAIADEKGFWVANTVWMLDDFTTENGATRVVPGSHHWRKLPREVLADPQAPHPREILVMGKAGDVVVMNAHAWHGGTANRTALPRRALHGFYTRYDKPRQQYQKQLLRPETIAILTAEQRRVLAIDDPLNDELSATGHSRSGFLK
jgi:Phytanoyl-CoA dioxygenase (PhyH)